MRKIILIFIVGLLLAWPAVAGSEDAPRRGLYVSVIQNPQTLSSREEVLQLIDFAKQARVKILFVQIYRANQAWFPSTVADQTPYEKCLKSFAEDPLAFLIRKAHHEGIEVHAWLNLLSLSTNTKARIIARYGPEVLTRNLKPKNKLTDYKIDNQYFLEPGDPRVREDLVRIVDEILRAYPALDGIQFDYIRYPDVNPHYGYTKANVERFREATGLTTIDDKSKVWADWKRDQVTELLQMLVKKARALRPQIQVSTTGCMPLIRAYAEAFQDWPSWIARGLVDFVTVMNYSPDPAEFARWNATLKTKVSESEKIKMAVGAYKLVRSPKVFEKEWRLCEEQQSACVVFFYGSLLENPALSRFLKNAPVSK